MYKKSISKPLLVHGVWPTGNGYEVQTKKYYEVVGHVSGPHGLRHIEETKWAILVPLIYIKVWLAVRKFIRTHY